MSDIESSSYSLEASFIPNKIPKDHKADASSLVESVIESSLRTGLGADIKKSEFFNKFVNSNNLAESSIISMRVSPKQKDVLPEKKINDDLENMKKDKIDDDLIKKRKNWELSEDIETLIEEIDSYLDNKLGNENFKHKLGNMKKIINENPAYSLMESKLLFQAVKAKPMKRLDTVSQLINETLYILANNQAIIDFFGKIGEKCCVQGGKQTEVEEQLFSHAETQISPIISKAFKTFLEKLLSIYENFNLKQEKVEFLEPKMFTVVLRKIPKKSKKKFQKPFILGLLGFSIGFLGLVKNWKKAKLIGFPLGFIFSAISLKKKMEAEETLEYFVNKDQIKDDLFKGIRNGLEKIASDAELNNLKETESKIDDKILELERNLNEK